MNTHFHGIIQYALKRGLERLQYPLRFTVVFDGMANSYDRTDLRKLQNYRGNLYIMFTCF